MWAICLRLYGALALPIRYGSAERGKTYTTKTIVLLIIPRFLDRIASYHSRIAVIVIGCISSEINLSKELLLMMLELAHHTYVVNFEFLILR